MLDGITSNVMKEKGQKKKVVTVFRKKEGVRIIVPCMVYTHFKAKNKIYITS